ncbi:MAG: CoA-binding protein [Candidatus Aenigmarchaeota archaeon]|nr:CoA-binding protein [Candidatus Aenigmarchaeota archaeon]
MPEHQIIAMLSDFFNPKTAAIIGASSNPKKFGHTILKNFIEDFKGETFAVNPNEKEVLNKKCYASVQDIKKGVDLAVVAVPPSFSNNVVAECVKKKVGAVVLITAGYREIGGEGIGREEELKNLIAGTKTRIIGPNCLGIYDTSSCVNTMFLPEYKLQRPPAGKIAFISQSGALGSAVLDWAATEHIGLSKFISYGNRADVDEVDLLEYLRKDRNTESIILYIEGPRDGRALMQAIKNTVKTKPVVILKAGRSDAGQKAAISHTGSLAGSYDVFEGAMKQAGAILCNNMEDMFDYGRVLAYQPRLKGKKIGIVTNGGGFGILCTDACIRHGLELAEFSKETVGSILPVMPKNYSQIRNPLDLIGDATADRYAAALNALIKDRNVDGIIALSLLQTSTLGPEITDVLLDANSKSNKPIVFAATGGEYTQILLRTLEKDGLPTYPSPERAVKAMSVLAR